MLCRAYFGELSEKRKHNWNCADDNPYDVLKNPIKLTRKGHDLWEKGQKYFKERIQIDWGSYAWKCSEEQIVVFLEQTMTEFPWLKEGEKKEIENIKQYIKEHGDTQYGIVFVEEA